MKAIGKIVAASGLILALASCNNNKNKFDASGSFEAEEVIVSAEQSGKIIQFTIEEGQRLDSNSIIGQIDVTALNIQKEQVKATVNAIIGKVNNAAPQVHILQSQIITQKAQIHTLHQQLAVLNKEVERMKRLVDAERQHKNSKMI